MAVPGPPGTSDRAAETTEPGGGTGGSSPFADLTQLPVSEHVAVFEAEHARLQRELATIDQV
ncbi:hypothetical protein GCU56_22765 [Geodermatophilus sabuli]|uniref:Uncharacterized protein n=1 Tax=Geodermatophilus sabuli TaxID=1564158 RepID=A0A7K3W8I4_9ACTN|nr:hypothetical protein [Geodermatophilus sabuli]NEK60683.1 hypothetical protein [Geodermatophilus sabuli]